MLENQHRSLHERKTECLQQLAREIGIGSGQLAVSPKSKKNQDPRDDTRLNHRQTKPLADMQQIGEEKKRPREFRNRGGDKQQAERREKEGRSATGIGDRAVEATSENDRNRDEKSQPHIRGHVEMHGPKRQHRQAQEKKLLPIRSGQKYEDAEGKAGE